VVERWWTRFLGEVYRSLIFDVTSLDNITSESNLLYTLDYVFTWLEQLERS
jgi:hypothetical protein